MNRLQILELTSQVDHPKRDEDEEFENQMEEFTPLIPKNLGEMSRVQKDEGTIEMISQLESQKWYSNFSLKIKGEFELKTIS